MRTTLFRLLKELTEAMPFPGPVYEFGAYRVPGQEQRGSIVDYFTGLEFIGCDMRPGPGVDRVEDLHSLSLLDESIGTALLFDTIEHVRDPWRAMAEIHRCLRPDGILVMTSHMYFPIHAHPEDYWRFTDRGFASLLQAFNIIAIESCGLKKLPHTVAGVASKQRLPANLAAALGAALRVWKRRRATTWKEVALALLPPVLLIPAYDLFALLLEMRSRKTLANEDSRIRDGGRR